MAPGQSQAVNISVEFSAWAEVDHSAGSGPSAVDTGELRPQRISDTLKTSSGLLASLSSLGTEVKLCQQR